MRLWERENARNERNEALFRAMILLAYPDTELVVAGHHIFHKRPGGAAEEIPSADWLLFDHTIAKACWGEEWAFMLQLLACTDADLRDGRARVAFNERHGTSF
jgi:hypothetical protein